MQRTARTTCGRASGIAGKRIRPLSCKIHRGGGVKFSPDIDLGRSLRQVFGNDPASSEQIEQDRRRQTRTAKAILQRFFSRRMLNRREMVILADEVGLGKTYVAIAVAVSILDAIRRGNTPSGFPTYRPLVLVLTPSNDSLFNKWKREMEAFKQNCVSRQKLLIGSICPALWRTPPSQAT